MSAKNPPRAAEEIINLVAGAIEKHMPAQVRYWQENAIMRAELIGPLDAEYVSPLPAARAALAALESAGWRLVPADDLPSENGLRHISTYYRDTVGSILADNCVKAADLVAAIK